MPKLILTTLSANGNGMITSLFPVASQLSQTIILFLTKVITPRIIFLFFSLFLSHIWTTFNQVQVIRNPQNYDGRNSRLSNCSNMQTSSQNFWNGYRPLFLSLSAIQVAIAQWEPVKDSFKQNMTAFSPASTKLQLTFLVTVLESRKTGGRLISLSSATNQSMSIGDGKQWVNPVKALSI